MTLGVDQPSWIEILQAASDRVRTTIHVGMPGVIVDYDPSTCTATVQLGVQAEQDDGSYETIPPLTDVPIEWPSGGGFSLTFPLAAGDPVNVRFSETDPAAFRRSGDVEQPDNVRRFGLYAAAAPCGAYVDGKAPRAVSGKAVLTGPGGVSVCLDGTLVNLGADAAADFVALAAHVATELAKITTWATNVTTAVNALSPGSVTPLATFASVAATKVKAT